MYRFNNNMGNIPLEIAKCGPWHTKVGGLYIQVLFTADLVLVHSHRVEIPEIPVCILYVSATALLSY